MPLALNKMSWAETKFGDVVSKSSEKVDPHSGEIVHYVAGDHMDSDNLAICRRGDVTQKKLGPAFQRRFRPGQVLYGTRRTYLRKVAVADFDGVCANTTLALTTRNEEKLSQRFLPFVMSANQFHEFSVGKSQGSVNPYVNWSDLTTYQFRLPPMEEQERLADLLWSVEDHLKGIRHAENVLHEAWNAYCGTVFMKWLDEGATELENLYDFQIGKRLSPEARTRGGDSLAYLTNMNTRWRKPDLTEIREMPFTKKEQELYALRDGDVLACEARAIGRSFVWREQLPGAMYQMSVHRLRHRSGGLTPDLLVEYLHWSSVAGRFRGLVGEGTIPHLPEVRFRKLLAPTPSEVEAEKFNAARIEMGEAIQAVCAERDAVEQTKKAILQEVFS